MTTILLAMTIFLLVNILVGLLRVARGPTRVDRMLAAQLFGTTGVAILLLLAQAAAEPALRDVGLVFALLAMVTTAVFGRGGGGETPRQDGRRWG